LSEEQIEWPEFVGIQGPSVSHFLLCEKVLTEEDGVQSLIRVIDYWAANGAEPPYTIEPTLAIGLSGLKELVGETFWVLAYEVTSEQGGLRMFSAQLTIPEGVEQLKLTVTPRMDLPRLGNYRFSLVFQGVELVGVDFEMRASPVSPPERPDEGAA